MKWVIMLATILCMVGLVTSSFHSRTSITPASQLKIQNIRGGKRPNLKTMFKAFWLTLVDPRNEESLRYDIDKRKSDWKVKKGRKGRSLKD